MLETIKFPCPNCKGQHALVWYERKAGRQLGVICDLTFSTSKTKFYKLPQSKTDNIDETELANIPVYYTPQAAKKISSKSELQFVLMNAQPDETVERHVELPKFRESDEAAAKRLQLEIGQRTQAQKELSALIEKAARQRIELENEERELRSKLREVWTQTLTLE